MCLKIAHNFGIIVDTDLVLGIQAQHIKLQICSGAMSWSRSSFKVKGQIHKIGQIYKIADNIPTSLNTDLVIDMHAQQIKVQHFSGDLSRSMSISQVKFTK